MKRDPYADLDQVYAEETSRNRIAVKPTPKTPTEKTSLDTQPNGMIVVQG